jgi:NAD(P)-dependent dehydrogenase (short-subunit alcohol dehydrogenase family)
VTTEPITIFGEADIIGLAVADGLSAHGKRVHLVSARTGWLGSGHDAVADVDTAAGAAALRDLRADDGDDPVVVLSSADNGRDATASVRSMCRSCAAGRGVALVWHESGVEPERLAAEVVRHVENPVPTGELVEEWMSDGS